MNTFNDPAIEHREEGVWWFDAPLPSRFHRCVTWTRGWVGFSQTERCACGATRLGGRGRWIEKNQRRHR